MFPNDSAEGDAAGKIRTVDEQRGEGLQEESKKKT
jgi:hypothetical protein